MAQCEYCQKKPSMGNQIEHRGKAKYLGGVGTKVTGITRREFEILELIAQGMSNREIAGKLYVSENTVKTHSSRLFDKLGAKRRTQAVQIGKNARLIP